MDEYCDVYLRQLVGESAYMPATIAKENEVNLSTFYGWMRGNSPRDKLKASKIIVFLENGDKRMEKHPSYGYATKEEIERLQSMKVGVDYYELLKKIAKRTKQKGRKK